MDGIGTAELIAYVFIWTGSVFYSMYQFYLSSECKFYCMMTYFKFSNSFLSIVGL